MSEEKYSLNNMPAPDDAMQIALKEAWKALALPPQADGFAYSAPVPFKLDFPDHEIDLLKECREREIDSFKKQAMGLSGDALEKFMEKLKKLESARTIGELIDGVAQLQQDLVAITAQAELEAGGKAAAGIEAARRAEIWRDIDRLNEENRKNLDVLAPYLTDEEKQKEIELEKALEEAKKTGNPEKIEEAQINLSTHQKQTGRRVEIVARDRGDSHAEKVAVDTQEKAEHAIIKVNNTQNMRLGTDTQQDVQKPLEVSKASPLSALSASNDFGDPQAQVLPRVQNSSTPSIPI